ncbi:hypothetical protein ACN6MT_29070 [Neobacillus niacini]|uniref:hypothetical protein n=1 Tax=Neobacillus niacini TaxID=86668 RepID=UPI003B024007
MNYLYVTVEAGAKRLAPFANGLIKMLDAKISLSLNPEYTHTIIDTLFNGKIEVKTWFKGLQNVRNYGQLDLDGTYSGACHFF